MLGPGLSPRAQAAADRMRPFAQAYYKAWAARIQQEKEASKHVFTVPDEMMNELDDSDDDIWLPLRMHAPTPVSMPSSPVLASMSKPTSSTLTINSNTIEPKADWQNGSRSPVDVDTSSEVSRSWQTETRSSSSQISFSRRPSDLVEHLPSPSVLSCARSSPRAKFLRTISSTSLGQRSPSTLSSRQLSSRRKGHLSSKKDKSAVLHGIRRGRVPKRSTRHRDLN